MTFICERWELCMTVIGTRIGGRPSAFALRRVSWITTMSKLSITIAAIRADCFLWLFRPWPFQSKFRTCLLFLACSGWFTKYVVDALVGCNSSHMWHQLLTHDKFAGVGHVLYRQCCMYCWDLHGCWLSRWCGSLGALFRGRLGWLVACVRWRSADQFVSHTRSYPVLLWSYMSRSLEGKVLYLWPRLWCLWYAGCNNNWLFYWCLFVACLLLRPSIGLWCWCLLVSMRLLDYILPVLACKRSSTCCDYHCNWHNSGMGMFWFLFSKHSFVLWFPLHRTHTSLRW